MRLCNIAAICLAMGLAGCDLLAEPEEPLEPEPEEDPLPSGYVRVCHTLDGGEIGSRNCVGTGHWGGERAPVVNSAVNTPLATIPVRACYAATPWPTPGVDPKQVREACANPSVDSTAVLARGVTDSDGYVVFNNLPRREHTGYYATGDDYYWLFVDADSVEYDGCTIRQSVNAGYFQIGPRVPTTPPRFHSAHIAEIWMVVESCD